MPFPLPGECTFSHFKLLPLCHVQVTYAADVIRVYAPYMACSCMMWALRGTLNGCGKQADVGKIAIFSAYLVGLPSGRN